MTDDELKQHVRDLRARGLSPKEIARTLGVRPAAVAHLVPAIAAERDAATPEADLAGCWVSPGWSIGLSIDARRGWPDAIGTSATGGLVTTAVARRQRHRRNAAVCVYLVDVYCLGVKNAIGPRQMDDQELRAFIRQVFGGYESPPVAAPIALVRNLVYGAVEYARALGFNPHPDFAPAREHLGPWSDPSAIRFGLDGKPTFVQGPHDDAASVMGTLRRSVGPRGFGFTVSADPEDLRLAG